MAEENQRHAIPMSSYYHSEKLRLQLAIRRGESMEEEPRTLDAREKMEFKAIWNDFNGLWPMVHQLPTT